MIRASTLELTGRRVLLRPLVEHDFAQWQEVRRRCRSWLVPWEPRPPMGSSDAVKGEVLWAFVVLGPDWRPGEELRRELTTLVADQLGRSFRPSSIRFAAALPKTRNAKVLRSPSRSSTCTACRSPSSPATGPADAWSRSSVFATRGWRCATSRSTAAGRTTSASPSPPRNGPSAGTSSWAPGPDVRLLPDGPAAGRSRLRIAHDRR
ncbi:MAG: hypothetical protein E6G01_00245 [Actinobacteria bacterium]|nr:MAG: hypothetical protein E6G01_00245 [Actinomycetota bacterium]